MRCQQKLDFSTLVINKQYQESYKTIYFLSPMFDSYVAC